MSEKTRDALAQHILNNQETVINALEYYARRMNEEARHAREQYEAGQADPRVKAAQDRSMMLNVGYRQSAEMFAGNAWRVTEIIEGLRHLIDKSHIDDNDERGHSS